MMTSTDYGWSPTSRYGAFVGDAFMGGTFVWMKQALNAAQSFTQTYDASSVVGIMVGFRFLLAAFILLTISSTARQSLSSKSDWTGSIWLGIAMLLGYGIQMVGLESISPSVSAFLTSLYVVFSIAKCKNY